jgi:hypothetical protein
MKSNVFLNELFNKLIEQANTINDLKKENYTLKQENTLLTSKLDCMEENEKHFKVVKDNHIIKRFPYALERAMDIWFKEWDVNQCSVMIESITRLVEKPYSVLQYNEHTQRLEWYKDSRQFEDGVVSYEITLDGEEENARDTD